MFISGFEPDSNGIKLAFECPETDKIELSILSTQILLVNCLRLAIEKQDYKQIFNYADMVNYSANVLKKWAAQKIQETEPSDN